MLEAKGKCLKRFVSITRQVQQRCLYVRLRQCKSVMREIQACSEVTGQWSVLAA